MLKCVWPCNVHLINGKPWPTFNFVSSLINQSTQLILEFVSYEGLMTMRILSMVKAELWRMLSIRMIIRDWLVMSILTTMKSKLFFFSFVFLSCSEICGCFWSVSLFIIPVFLDIPLFFESLFMLFINRQEECCDSSLCYRTTHFDILHYIYGLFFRYISDKQNSQISGFQLCVHL